MIASSVAGQVIGTRVTYLRLVRVAKAIHLIGHFRSLAVILGAILGSLRRVAWTFALILLVSAVYRRAPAGCIFWFCLRNLVMRRRRRPCRRRRRGGYRPAPAVAAVP